MLDLFQRPGLAPKLDPVHENRRTVLAISAEGGKTLGGIGLGGIIVLGRLLLSPASLEAGAVGRNGLEEEGQEEEGEPSANILALVARDPLFEEDVVGETQVEVHAHSGRVHVGATHTSGTVLRRLEAQGRGGGRRGRAHRLPGRALGHLGHGLAEDRVGAEGIAVGGIGTWWRLGAALTASHVHLCANVDDKGRGVLGGGESLDHRGRFAD